MPNKKSAKKRVLVAERNRQRNQGTKSAVRTAVKKARLAIADAADNQASKAALKNAQSLIDRAVLKGVINKNKASRDKSRLMLAAKKEA